MSSRVRSSVLLCAVFAALGIGSYWLWRSLRPAHGSDAPDAPALGSSRRAIEGLEGDAPAGPPENEGTSSGRRAVGPGTRRPGSDDEAEDRTARLFGSLVSPEGRAIGGARILLAPWIENEELDPRAPKPLVPARIAVHLPLDLADPAGAGLPVPLRFDSDDAGNFRCTLPPGRWRLLVRSACAPFERNDLRLSSGEERDLGRLVLRQGVVYRLELALGKNEGLRDVIAAPRDPALGAGIPPLGGALAQPFLRAPAEGSRVFTSVPQRRVPLEVELCAPHARTLDVELNPAQRERTLALALADELSGRLGAPSQPDTARFQVHARPLDFFEAPVAARWRADLAAAEVKKRAFEIDVRARAETFELRAAFGEDPPLLASPWSPPVFWSSPPDPEARPERFLLREPLLWRADARVAFEVIGAGGSPPPGPVEVLLQGIYARGHAPGDWIELAGPRCRLDGLRRLSGSLAAISIRAQDSEELTLPLALTEASDLDLGRLSLSPRASLRVRALDAQTRRPIAGATLSFASGEWSDEDLRSSRVPLARTDERGEARAIRPADSFGYLEVSAAGYAPASALAFEQAPGGTLAVELVRGANVKVRVLDADAAPQRSARVECTRGTWSPSSGTPSVLEARFTDSEGVATFAHAAPGEHAFRVHVPGSRRTLDASEWSIVHLGDGETRLLTLSTRARAELRVRVTSDVRALPDLRLTLETEGLGKRSETRPLTSDEPLPHGIDAWTDALGEARFEDLDAQLVRVTLSLPRSGLRLRKTLQLHSGLNRLGFDPAEAQELAFAEASALPFDLELHVLPPARPVELDDRPIEFEERELERFAHLDRRGARPDLVFAAGERIALPADLAPLRLRFSAAGVPRALELPRGLEGGQSLLPELAPTTALELGFRELRPGERYVVLLGRQRPDAPPSEFQVERAVPFVATARDHALRIEGLFAGELRLLATRVIAQARGRYALRPMLDAQLLMLALDAPNQLRLAPTR